ncbi:MAG: ABC transporter ATP-binding protein [Brooklawnia sp.]|jgi:putative spermidine/putrescine transport system ATP-binding protein
MTTASAFKTLELKNVGRTFSGIEALAGLNLTVRAGEFIALLGPSGCGKSTALNCLAGLLPLTHGEIRIDGERIDSIPAEKRDFGMVFQNYALFPHMTVQKNIAFGLEMRRMPRAEITKRVDQAIEMVKLQDYRTRLPGQLSGGQQQRVAIARVIALHSRLVLMDEPLSNLDAKLRLEMRSEIRRLHQNLGFTTIYVTHDQEEALSLADRLVVLRLGRVQQIGTPAELYERPNNWHVAEFMGYRNLLPMTMPAGTGARAGEIAHALHDGNGLSIRGTAMQDISPGATVRLAIRPEDLRVLQPDDPGDGLTVIPGTTGIVEYQGREYAVNVETSGFMLHIRSETAPAAGAPVRLGVRPERALLYPAELTERSEVEAAIS